jgi:hypothetical protein
MRRAEQRDITYLILGVVDLDPQLLHGLQDHLICVVDVGEDDRSPVLAFGFGKARGVDQLHLLKHRGLATLSGTCERETSAI